MLALGAISASPKNLGRVNGHLARTHNLACAVLTTKGLQMKFIRELTKSSVSPETEACIIVLTPIILSVVLLAIAGGQR
jgi:hypothetical protein